MTRVRRVSIVVLSLALFLVTHSARAGLTHRYSFSDSTGKDSVGNVDVTLKGTAKVADGKVVLDNGEKVSSDPAISYVQFNSSPLPKTGSVSLVVWITAKENPLFSRVIDFGDTQNGEGFAFIYLVARHEDEKSRGSITASDTGSKSYLTGSRLDDSKPHMAVLVINGATKKLHLSVDTVETEAAVDLGDNTLDKVAPATCFLGRSHFDADPGLSGAIDEFRVYDHALSPEEIAAIYKAGPDVLPPPTPPAAGK